MSRSTAGGAGGRFLAPTAAAAALLLLAAACGDGGPEEPAGVVPDSVYVEAMARLVLLDTAVSPTLEPAPAGAALDSARERVLTRWGVDAEDLLEFARNRGEDPERMQAVWQRVYEMSGSLKEDDWRPLPDSLDPLAGDTLPGAAPARAGDTVGGPDAGARQDTAAGAGGAGVPDTAGSASRDPSPAPAGGGSDPLPARSAP